MSAPHSARQPDHGGPLASHDALDLTRQTVESNPLFFGVLLLIVNSGNPGLHPRYVIENSFDHMWCGADLGHARRRSPPKVVDSPRINLHFAGVLAALFGFLTGGFKH